MQISPPTNSEFRYIFGRFKMLEHTNGAYIDAGPKRVLIQLKLAPGLLPGTWNLLYYQTIRITASPPILFLMEISPYPVVDLFVGPGGLGEGFAVATGSNKQFTPCIS